MRENIPEDSDNDYHESGNYDEERYRFFLESVLNELPIPTSVKSVARGTKYIFWNKEAERMFGITKEELLGKDAYPFLSARSAAEMMALNEEVVKTGQRFTGIVDTNVVANGTRHLLAVNKSMVSYKDEYKWLITSVQDVTEFQEQKDRLQAQRDEMREMNEKLDLAFRASQQMPWTWNVAKRELHCDFSYDEVLGPYMSQFSNRKMSRDEYYKFVYEEDHARLTMAMDEVAGGIRPSLREEFRLARPTMPDGQHIWLETYGIVSKRDENGKAVQLIGTFQQITMHKKMEIELREARDKAEESNRLKSAFLANMSHEIRTPLNAIVGFSGIMAGVDSENERKEFLHIINSNNELLLQLIGDILDLSKIEAGTLDFSFAATDVNAALAELEASSRLRLKTDKVRIEFAERLPECTIYTDRNRIMQVMMNFVTNAMKFTSRGSIRFGYRLENNDTFIRFYVADTGCGISEENLPRIFGRFIKVNNFAQGTGLGLAISEMIVKRMGGEIGADSVLGEGSTFWFTLPYKPAEKEETSCVGERTTVGKRSVTIDDNENIKILIAEDNESNYRLFEAILKKRYTIIHAWNGQEAVDLFSKENPHLVLSDIRMPVMDGYEVLARIRQQDQSVPVIAVTAFTQPEDKKRIFAAGFDDFVSKPVDATVLHDKITDNINRVYGGKK